MLDSTSKWLDKCVNGVWRLNEDGVIDVKGSVYINNTLIAKFPVLFGNVDGIFMCRCPNLSSVEGFPTHAKQYIFDKCLFPAHYYLGAIEQGIDIENYLAKNILQLQVSDDEVKQIEHNFPNVYHTYRGHLNSKKFGF